MKKLGIDWTQRTTRHGAMLLIAGLLATVLILQGKLEQAAAIMSVVSTVIGTLGFAIKD